MLTGNENNAIYKYIPPEDITVKKNKKLFSYNIMSYGDGFSLSSMVKGYNFTIDNPTYYSILNKYYNDQYFINEFNEKRIYPTSYALKSQGLSSCSSILVFSFNSFLSKDGISNLNPEKNIVLNINAVSQVMAPPYDYDVFGKNSNKNIKCVIYDKRHSATSGNIFVKVDSSYVNGGLSAGALNYDIVNFESIPVGKILYNESLILIDSFNYNQLVEFDDGIVVWRYIVPSPIVNGGTFAAPDVNGYFNMTSVTSGNIEIISEESLTSGFGYGSFIYGSGSYSYSAYDKGIFWVSQNDVSVTSSLTSVDFIILDGVSANFVLNTNVYTINVNIDESEFNYSENLKDGNQFYRSADSKTPIWFNKINFYDYRNNVLGVATFNMPIKNDNKKNIKIKIMAEY